MRLSTVIHLLLLWLVGTCLCLENDPGPGSTPIGVTIDIRGDLDGKIFNVQYAQYDNRPCRVIVPKSGHLLNAVFDANTLIWEKGSENFSTLVVLDNNQVIFVYLKDANCKWTRIMYKRSGDGWALSKREEVVVCEFNNGKDVCKFDLDPHHVTRPKNGQPAHHVRKELEHEPKGHVKTSQASQEDTIPSPIPTIKDAKLDITDVDLKIFTMSESFMDGMLVKKTFTPNDGCRLTEIYDLNMPIWASTDPKEHTKTVLVYYNGGSPVSLILIYATDGKIVIQCYKEQNGSWKEVDQDTPSQKHQGMKNDTPKEALSDRVPTAQPATPGKESREVELDIMDVDANIFNITHSKEGDVPIKTISPKSGYRLTEIYSLNVPIWTSSGESCSLATVHYNGEKPILASLVLNQGHAYLEYKDGRWKNVDKNGYYAKRDSLKSDVYRRGKSALGVREVELDVADVDVNVFTTRDSFLDGFLIRSITPKDGYRLTEIYDLNMPIWVSNDEYCTSAWAYYDEERPILAVVDVQIKGTRLYHHKRRGGWTRIEEDECKKLFRDMRNSKVVKGVKPKPAGTMRAQKPPRHSPQYYTKPIELDTQDIHSDKIAVTDCDGRVTTFCPKSGNYLSKFIHNGSEVWKGDKGVSASACSKNAHLARVDVLDASGTEMCQCFELQGNNWITLEYDSYITKLNKQLSDISFDISNPSYDTCNLLQYYEGGILYKVGVPLPDYRLKALYYGLKIWESSGDEYCKKFTLLSFEGHSLCVLENVRMDGHNACEAWSNDHNGDRREPWMMERPDHNGMARNADAQNVDRHVDTQNDHNGMDTHYVDAGDHYIISMALEIDQWIVLNEKTSKEYLVEMERLRSKYMSVRILNPGLRVGSTVDVSKVNLDYIEIIDKSVEKACLDLMAISDIFSVCRHRVFNMDIMEYTPRPKYFVNEVRNGEELIWKTHYRSLSVSHIPAKGLMLLYIKRVQIEPLFLAKCAKWNVVDEQAFIAKLNGRPNSQNGRSQ